MVPTTLGNKRFRMIVMAILAFGICLALILLLRAQNDPSKTGQLDNGQGSTQQTGIKRTDLQRHDLSVPGREVVQVRVDIPAGISFPKHSHPGEEVVYMIEGTLEYSLEGKPPVTLKAGEVLFIPAGTIHSVKNVGSGNGAELATYIVEKGKPLLVPAK